MEKAGDHQIRKCLACSTRAPKVELVRVVWNGEQLVADLRQRMQGRGAYVHRARGCIERAREPKRWEHALRLGSGRLTRDALTAVQEILHAVLHEVVPGGEEPQGTRRLGIGKVSIGKVSKVRL